MALLHNMVLPWCSHGALITLPWRPSCEGFSSTLEWKFFSHMLVACPSHGAYMALHYGALHAIFFLNIKKEFFFPWCLHGTPYGRVSSTLEWKHFFPMALFHDMAHPWRPHGASYMEVLPLR